MEKNVVSTGVKKKKSYRENVMELVAITVLFLSTAIPYLISEYQKMTAIKPELNLDCSAPVEVVAFSPDSQHFATGSRTNVLKIFRVEDGTCEKTIYDYPGFTLALEYSSDGKYIASLSSTDLFKLYDASSGECLKSFDLIPKSNPKNPILQGAFSNDCKYLATKHADESIKIWDISQMECVHTFADSRNPYGAIAFSPDGTTLAFVQSDQTASFWSIEETVITNRIKIKGSGSRYLAFTPEGKHIVTTGWQYDDIYELSNVDDGSVTVYKIGLSSYYPLTISPDGKYIAGHGDKTELWRLQDASRIRTFNLEQHSIRSIMFSPDGRYIATSGDEKGDYAVKIWSMDKLTGDNQG